MKPRISPHRLSVLLVVIASFCLLIWKPVFGWHRPYINWAPWDLAEYLAKNDRPVSECLDLLWLEIMAPSQGETRAHCIHEYAELTKDPSACELLMPSSYGWSCLGGAKATADACSIDYGKEVSWLIGSDVYNDWETATMSQCKQGLEESKKGQDCCYILELTSEPEMNDCSRFQDNESFMNLCISQLALKKGDASLCNSVTDENKRVICELHAKYK